MRLTRIEACKLLGLTLRQLSYLQQQGKIPSSGCLTMAQAMAIAVAKSLKVLGCDEPSAKAVMGLLWVMSDDDLEAAMERGQQYLLVIKPTVLPWLLTLEALSNPGGVDVKQFCRLSKVEPEVYDLAKVYRGIQLEANKLRIGTNENAGNRPDRPSSSSAPHEPVASRVSQGGPEQA